MDIHNSIMDVHNCIIGKCEWAIIDILNSIMGNYGLENVLPQTTIVRPANDG